MIFLFAFILTALLILLYMRFEAGFIKIERVNFASHTKGLKILQLSDIHIKYLKISVERLNRIILAEKPDIIIMTGDYIDNPRQATDFLKFLKAMKKDVKNVNTYMCMGNHDHKTFPATHTYKTHNKLKVMEVFSSILECNVNDLFVLTNQSVTIEKESKKYNIIGIDDLNAGNPDIGKALEHCEKNNDTINIAFSHNPDIIFNIPEDRIDYLFCGHFHGGQIWMPFNFEFFLLREEKLCKMGINRGLHKLNGIILYINRGLGNVCFPLRFLSRPEVTIFYMP